MGYVGARIASLAAFKQKPPSGGSPARFRRRAAERKSWTGDRALRDGSVLGEEVRAAVKRPRRGRIMRI